jgi:hypothetical protein
MLRSVVGAGGARGASAVGASTRRLRVLREGLGRHAAWRTRIGAELTGPLVLVLWHILGHWLLWHELGRLLGAWELWQGQWLWLWLWWSVLGHLLGTW